MAVAGHILTAFINQVGEGPKPEKHQLLVQRIELAQWGNMPMQSTEVNIAFKRALGRN